MNRKIIFFLSLLLAANLVEAAVDLTLVPNSRTVVAGTSQQVNFTNTGSSNGRYSMAWVNGREDWMTIVNDNNNTDSGFIVLSPPAGVSGTFTVNIKASQFLSSTESDTETLTVNVTATTQPLTLSVSNFTAQENTVFVIPVGVDGGTPPYTGSITAGSFPGSTQLFYDAVDNRLRFNTTFLSVASTTTYNFTFQITDNAGESVSDNFSVTITNGTTSKPNPPASLSTTAQSPSQIDVSWSSVSGVSDVSTGLYELSRSTFPGSGYQVVYSGTDRNFSDSTGLSEDTLYYYRVRAFTTQFSDYSDPSSARTQEANNNNPRPDLVPENPTASPLQPIPGQYLNGGLDVSNQGLAGASSGSVRFYLDKDSPTFGNQISTQFYSVVGAGQSESVSFQYLIPASLDDGTYFLSYKVDAQNTEINESNENNNTGSLQIQIDSDSTPVDTPPFHVDSVFSPSLPVANQAFSIYAYMDDSNEGDPIEGVEFRYRSNGGSYSQGFPMRYVSNSHNPPLFINEDSFSLPSAGSYNFQYRAVGADWQGSTNLTIQEPLDWDLQFNSLAFNGSSQLTAQVGLTGNVQEIDCDFGIIPASSSGSNNEIAGTFITKKISGGQTVTATFSRTMLSNLPLGVDYQIRGLFEDRNGTTQVRLSAPFSPPADQTAITGISTPKVELSPDAIATLGFSVSSAVPQALHLKLSVIQANGNDTAPLVSSLSEFSLLRGNNEIVTDFLVPTGIAIDDYDVVASLWRDANGNRILDSGDQRVTSDRTFENAITLFGGNNPADSNNDSVDDAWQTSNGAIDINADNDGDGRLNWHEYVFGSDPNGRDDSTAQIAIVSDPVLGLNFVDFTYLRRRDLDDGIYTILVETSDDMVTWEDASICFIANRIVDHGNGTETVTFRCTEPTQVNQSLFIRARGLKNTTNGGERFLTRTDILLNALEAQNNGYNNPGTVRYSNPYLRFTTGINLNTLGLETIFDFYRHILSVTSDLSGIEFINNKLAPIPPFGSLVFFGDENLDLHLRVPSVLNLTGDQKEYLDRIRAQGLIGISLGNGLILVPDFTGAIVEIDLASGLDFLGVGVTQQLCLGHVTAEHAQRASNFAVSVNTFGNRLVLLNGLNLSNNTTQDAEQAITDHDPIALNPTIADFVIPTIDWDSLPFSSTPTNEFIGIKLQSRWLVEPLSSFVENGEVDRLAVFNWLLDKFDEAFRNSVRSKIIVTLSQYNSETNERDYNYVQLASFSPKRSLQPTPHYPFVNRGADDERSVPWLFERSNITLEDLPNNEIALRVDTDDDNRNLRSDYTEDSYCLDENDLTAFNYGIQSPYDIPLLIAAPDNVSLTWGRSKGIKIPKKGNYYSINSSLTFWMYATGIIENQKLELFLDINGTPSSKIHEIDIFTHKTLVLAFSGEVDVLSDFITTTPNDVFAARAQDIYTISEALNDRHFNIVYYPESAVNSTSGSPLIGLGEHYSYLIDQIELGGVENLIVFGFSHGGGSVWEFLDALQRRRGATPALQSLNIHLSAYLDAIQQGSIDIRSETRFPPLTSRHVNFYQRNILPISNFKGNFVAGAFPLNQSDQDCSEYMITVNGKTKHVIHSGDFGIVAHEQIQFDLLNEIVQAYE